MRLSLFAFRRSWAAIMSISIPRDIRQVVEPSRLCSAIGMPRRAHAASTMPTASAQSGAVVQATTTKSSI